MFAQRKEFLSMVKTTAHTNRAREVRQGMKATGINSKSGKLPGDAEENFVGRDLHDIAQE